MNVHCDFHESYSGVCEECIEKMEELCERYHKALNEIAAWDFLGNASQWPSMKIARKALSHKDKAE